MILPRWLVAGLLCAVAVPAPAREGTEWMTAYWYNATDTALPRVLLVGDSIVKGYQAQVRDALAGQAYVAFYSTSKSVDDPAYLRELAYVLGEYDYAAVHFNNGLHSLGSDRGRWEQGLRAALALIREKGKGAKIVWATSTPLKDPALTAKVVELNAIAARVMKEENVPTDDLFALMDPLDRAKYWTDTYHYVAEGQKMQADHVAAVLREALGAKPATEAEARTALDAAASDTGPDGKIAPGTPPGVNLVANPGFEEAGKWSVYPPDPALASLSFSAENPHSGQKAAQFVCTQGGAQLYQSAPSCAAGTEYILTGWLRAESPSHVRVSLRSRKPPYRFSGDGECVADTEWKPFRIPVTTSADYAPEENALYLTFSVSGTYWIDDIRIEP